jgi:isoleucyl-tRNA synthetase
VVKVNTKLTSELKSEGLIRDVIRYVQTVRKEAALKVDDRINLALFTENAELERAIQMYIATIKTETLTLELSLGDKELKGFGRDVLIEGISLRIILNRSEPLDK